MEQRDLFQHVGEATLYIQLGFLAQSGAQIFELGSQAGESGAVSVPRGQIQVLLQQTAHELRRSCRGTGNYGNNASDGGCDGFDGGYSLFAFIQSPVRFYHCTY